MVNSDVGNSAPSAPFAPDRAGLLRSLELLFDPPHTSADLVAELPEVGIGPAAALDELAGPVLSDARDIGAPGFFAHMDPPTPWITWAMQMWTASRNQNLLHVDTAPVARELERRVVRWLCPWFGMDGGHMTSGSTAANLTAMWAAREAGARRVLATTRAHISVAKSAHLLGLDLQLVDDWDRAPAAPDDIAVITAGTTATGEIESLDAATGAGWRHVDAAWAGPLRLSDRHSHLLDGIDAADSVAVSAHKWLFQPKESALVLFADAQSAHAAISFGAEYLAVPNVGLAGSHGAAAVPLLATLLAYGRKGVADWIDATMEHAEQLWQLIDQHPALEARTRPMGGVVNWRHVAAPADQIQEALPPGVFVSVTSIDGEPWLRSVAANPMADPALVVSAVVAAAG